ncbi:hypothetical protein ACFX13_038608 [Malus domestica]
MAPLEKGLRGNHRTGQVVSYCKRIINYESLELLFSAAYMFRDNNLMISLHLSLFHDIPYRDGINTWKGKQLHSHSHLTPEPFRDQVVILLGSTPSAIDISRDIAGIAKEEMMEDVKAFYSSLEASGTPKHYTHNIYAYKVNSISLFPFLFCSLVSLPS